MLGVLRIEITYNASGAAGLGVSQLGSATVELYENGSGFDTKETGFLAWLRQRATGFRKTYLSSSHEEAGWLLPDILLAICGRLLQGPPVCLPTGRHPPQQAPPIGCCLNGAAASMTNALKLGEVPGFCRLAHICLNYAGTHNLLQYTHCCKILSGGRCAPGAHIVRPLISCRHLWRISRI